MNKKIISCNTCKWFIPNINDDYSKCKMFKEKSNIFNKDFDFIIYNYAKHCRSNENQCGKDGFFYEKNELFLKNMASKDDKIDFLKNNNEDLYNYTQFLENNK